MLVNPEINHFLLYFNEVNFLLFIFCNKKNERNSKEGF